MHWVVGTWLITSLLGLGMGHNTLFEGYDRTLSGYHLCNETELVSVTNVISYPTSYTQRRPCGGWLPWTMCDVTVYKTEYQTQVYNMSKQVTKCCHGYEQVGSYCALSLNRSAEFTSKPGLCSSASRSLRNNSNSSHSMCKWDIDCPHWQKCCQTENISNIYQCSDPVPPANRTCFNATITVKTNFELLTMDKGLFNHTRLLHSVVTGALGTAEISVHHVWSWSAGPFTTSSSLLVCSSKDFFLEDIISTRLYRLEKIEEVTDVVVQDVDECAVPELNSCSPHAHCMNTLGSYSCACHHGYHDLNSSQPGTVCMAPSVTTQPFMNNTVPVPPDNRTYTDGKHMSITPSGPFWTSTVDLSSHSNNPSISLPPSTCDYIPEITSLFSYDINASTFHVAWTTNNQTGVTFNLVLLHGTTELENVWHVRNFNWTFTNLDPAVLYIVRVTPFACGIRGNSTEIKVRTDGQLLLAAVRLTNVEYTEALSDPNSAAYKEFCRNVTNEILLSLEIRALVDSGQVIVRITSLSAGSVIVNFSIIFQPNSNLNMTSVSRNLIVSLQDSSIYVIDSSSIYIGDLNECLAHEADCSPWASCENTVGSYICACWSGYDDQNPSRPGRSCSASSNATTSTVNPTTNYPGVSSNSTATSTTTSSITITMIGNPSMSSTVSTAHVQSNTKTTESSTLANIPTTILAPITQDTVRITTFSQQIIGHLTSYVTVECSLGYISVVIRRVILQVNNINESALFLGKPECRLSGINASHVWLTTAWDKCGTTLEHNSTHNSFNVTLFNNASSSLMGSIVHLEVPIICTYPSRIIVSTGYPPSGYFNMINDPVAGLGSFQVTVRLLNGTSPLPEDYAFSPEEEVIVEVGVNTTISQIKVVISKCWATSSNDSSKSPVYLFLQDGCALPNSYTTVLQNGNDTVSLLSVRIFSFVNLDVIYLHCQVQICVEIQDKTCRPDCMVRSYRASNLIGATKASVGPLNRLRKEMPQNDTSNTLQTVGFVLLGVGVFLFSLAAIAGLVYHKRKIGNYNFNLKPQQENFNYHVFST
ncbi:uromodulin-like 1 isoform X1 [Ctenopharyngodon idella]|uniref:uromodulin-like 1 isoform X1 n=2 Tax=Ctenopharyngodon idella TaxID=7959 RepID=UPI002231372B|nr:uromodulin-like 1 isoform X1 [Ctenopharyngodon idella]